MRRSRLQGIDPAPGTEAEVAALEAIGVDAVRELRPRRHVGGEEAALLMARKLVGRLRLTWTSGDDWHLVAHIEPLHLTYAISGLHVLSLQSSLGGSQRELGLFASRAMAMEAAEADFARRVAAVFE